MSSLPKNVRIGRNGRIGILKKVPRDLWGHPRYVARAKVVERSTGTTDPAAGTQIALAMLAELEADFAAARAQIVPTASGNGLGADRSSVTARPNGASRSGKSTRRDILAAALKEFAARGYGGVRVDAIAARAGTTKAVIYYHFGSKEKLYGLVAEEAYGGLRSAEQSLRLVALPPREALRRLVEASFDHYAGHPEHVRLIGVENIEKGRHLSGRPSLLARNAAALETMRALLERGERDGAFRHGLEAWHLTYMIAALCFMRVSNRHSLQAVFGRDLWDENDVPAQRRMVVEAVLRYVAL